MHLDLSTPNDHIIVLEQQALAPLLHVDSVARQPGSAGKRMPGQRQEQCSVSGHCGIGSTSMLLPRIACPVAARQENDQGCNHIDV
jgi:hypothetical protein